MASIPYAFVSLITSDSYLPGALALAAALKDIHPYPPVPPEVGFQTVCLTTPESVDVSTIKLLRRAFDVVVGVEIIEQEDTKGLKLLGRLDLTTVLTKLHIFRLTQYKKIIFLDADILPIRPLSHLFSLPHEFSAVPDVGWPDIFNSGVLVLAPGEDKFTQLKELLKSKGSWDGGDQGLLNEWRGGDWNRLSFTYNTTPTAAYTYAPAYERYGSQISAIHFIGPNKPWNSITSRSPFQSTSQQKSNDPSDLQRTYDYDSLVDMWYAVYDKHYRSHAVLPEADFELQHYTAAWDEVGLQETKFPGANVGDAGTMGGGAGVVLGLEDLRRIAVEGMGRSLVDTTGDKGKIGGEGEYVSMPLEGRVDLMRPRKEEPVVAVAVEKKETEKKKEPPQLYLREASDGEKETEKWPESFTTPVRQNLGLSVPSDVGMSPVRWTTLPTPRPDEIPSAPHLRAMSLPPTPTPVTHVGYQPEESDEEGQIEEEHEEHERLEQLQEPQDSHSQVQQQPQSQEHHEVATHSHQEAAPRPHSPPLLSWNPAIEPPPTDIPTPSAFPSDTYFPNVWDKSPTRRHDDRQTHDVSASASIPTDSSLFFQPPPPSDIPESLVRQGHYRNVTGEEPHGSTPSPDRTKVKRVFPWEEKPRHFPGRTFPTSDAPLPEAFIIPETSPPAPAPAPSTPERAMPHHPVLTPSPLTGLPSNLTYANIWDTVPSIQKYANRLVRPPQPATILAPAFEAGRRRPGNESFRTWEDRTEASSRDGDDEDNADDSDVEKEEDGETRWEDDSDKGSGKNTLMHRSRSGSRSSIMKGKQVRYQDRAVQTVPREMRSRAVQVSVPLPTTTSPTLQTKRPRQDSGSTTKRTWPLAPSIGVLQPVVVQETDVGQEPSAIATPLTSRPSLPSMTLGSPSGIHSSREFALPASVSSPTLVHPPTSKPSTEAVSSPVLPKVSNGVSSPPSSVTAASPPVGQPIVTPVRRAGRVWDPARGVELFKRGSEGVLARFLKMGSWEDDAATHATERA